MNKKGLALVLALTLLVVGVVAGTLAWLTAKSDTVTNTFTTSDIKVELKETTGTEYKMIPGYTISKNPKATVLAGSETNVYYRKVQTADIGTAYSVLKGDQVTVKGEVTKAMMDGLTTETLPKLTVTAYASQLHKNATTEFTAAEAWANVNPTNP